MSRGIVTVIAIIAVAVILLAIMGVVHVRNTENDASITVDKKELKEKMHEAVEKTEETGGMIRDKTGAALRKAGEGLRGTSHDEQAPTTTKPPAPERERHP